MRYGLYFLQIPALLLLTLGGGGCQDAKGRGDGGEPPWPCGELCEEPEDDKIGEVDDVPEVEDGWIIGGDSPYSCMECSDHSECNDNIFCNGIERCGLKEPEKIYCCYTIPSCPQSKDDCHKPVCIEEQNLCIDTLKDEDRDGYVDMMCGGEDCNDDPDTGGGIFPGAEDICNNIDDNCNGIKDEEGWSLSGDSPVALGDASSDIYVHKIITCNSNWIAGWKNSQGGITVAKIDDGLHFQPSSPFNEIDGYITAIDLLCSSGKAYLLWSEVSEDGSFSTVKQSTIGDSPAIFPPATIFSKDQTQIHEMKARQWPGSSDKAGLFFTMEDSNRNYQIYYLPLEGYSSARDLTGIVDPVPITSTSQYCGNPDGVSDGSKWFVTWNDAREGYNEIYMKRIDFDGNEAGAETRVTFFPDDSTFPSLSLMKNESEKNQICLSWMDKRTGGFSIFFAIFDADEWNQLTQPAPVGELSGPNEIAIEPQVLAQNNGQFMILFSSTENFSSYSIRYSFVKYDSEVEKGKSSGALELEAEETKSFRNPSGSFLNNKVAIIWNEINTLTAEHQILLGILSCEY